MKIINSIDRFSDEDSVALDQQVVDHHQTKDSITNNCSSRAISIFHA